MEPKRPMRASGPGVHREITSVSSVLSHVATGDTSVPKDPSVPKDTRTKYSNGTSDLQHFIQCKNNRT